MARTGAQGRGLCTPTGQAEEEGSTMVRARRPYRRKQDALLKSERDREVEMGESDSKLGGSVSERDREVEMGESDSKLGGSVVRSRNEMLRI